MLLKLAELYDVNILHFYTLLGYVDTKDIIKYNNTNAYTSNDDIAIPLFDSINNIENKEVSIGKMNIPFSNTNSNLCFAFYYKKDIFIAYKTKELNFYDLFIFKANSKYFISKYFILDSTIILNDIQDDYKLYTFDKSIVKVVGKIIFQTKKLAKE